MKVGDLVNFETKAWVFEHANKDYVNPGIILSLTKDKVSQTRYSVEVYWADGRITNEHDSYVHLVEGS
jgi:hypothetical protein